MNLPIKVQVAKLWGYPSSETTKEPYLKIGRTFAGATTQLYLFFEGIGYKRVSPSTYSILPNSLALLIIIQIYTQFEVMDRISSMLRRVGVGLGWTSPLPEATADTADTSPATEVEPVTLAETSDPVTTTEPPCPLECTWLHDQMARPPPAPSARRNANRLRRLVAEDASLQTPEGKLAWRERRTRNFPRAKPAKEEEGAEESECVLGDGQEGSKNDGEWHLVGGADCDQQNIGSPAAQNRAGDVDDGEEIWTPYPPWKNGCDSSHTFCHFEHIVHAKCSQRQKYVEISKAAAAQTEAHVLALWTTGIVRPHGTPCAAVVGFPPGGDELAALKVIQIAGIHRTMLLETELLALWAALKIALQRVRESAGRIMVVRLFTNSLAVLRKLQVPGWLDGNQVRNQIIRAIYGDSSRFGWEGAWIEVYWVPHRWGGAGMAMAHDVSRKGSVYGQTWMSEGRELPPLRTREVPTAAA